MHTCGYASRELPARRARTLAIRDLQGYNEAVVRFEPNIDEDDVTNFEQEDGGDMVLSDEVQIPDDDETVENAEEWIHFAETSDSSDDEEASNPSIATDSCHSRDGTEWRTIVNQQGRRPTRNILEERPGFRPYLRPATIAEGFTLYLIQSSIRLLRTQICMVED